MRKIYTIVFALMVLLSVTMSAMAAPEAPASAPAIILGTPAPSGDTAPLEDETQHDTAKGVILNLRA